MEAVVVLKRITMIPACQKYMQDAYMEVTINAFTRVYTEGGQYMLSVRPEGCVAPATFPVDQVAVNRLIYRAFPWKKARAIDHAMRAIIEPVRTWHLSSAENKIKWGY